MTHARELDLVAGKYALCGELGVGGSATVYEAEHALTGRRVALKILHRELGRHPQIQARFLAEARAAATVRHKNVVDIYDVGIDEHDVAYMVMELLSGETLAELLESRGPLPYPYACELMLQVLSALSAAHVAGIVHRDLKPTNVMVTHPEPDRPRVKVLDFGIAKGILDRSEDALADGALLGTPVYMAPEQVLGREVDARADVYAAGVLLYELLSGVRPASGASPMELLTAVVRGRHTPLAELRPDLPEALTEVVEDALAVDPDDRPQSASALGARLVPFVSWEYLPSMRSEVSAEPIPLVDVKRAPRFDSFPSEDTLHFDASAMTLSEDLLFEPKIPRAPSAPHLDAESFGLAPGTPLPVGPEVEERHASTAPPTRASEHEPSEKGRLAPWLALLGGFGVGIALAWLSGVL
ncbi:MAG: serine/threonine protein kinase [Myxococcales bacterium]|nr:serine/threonine protein kinase [Myxococcales bacterium]MCB9576498.1 serine/threonine protein kinase [Polyangiaceae bacterium]